MSGTQHYDQVVEPDGATLPPPPTTSHTTKVPQALGICSFWARDVDRCLPNSLWSKTSFISFFHSSWTDTSVKFNK